MRIEVWEPEEKSAADLEGVVRVRLRQRSNYVVLESVGISGEWNWNLLSLTADGIERHISIDDSLGLPIDKQGRVKIVK